MQREIKFRVWNKRENQMIDDVFFKPESNEFILMQYTGLKDKNGKEIYEGDIVKGGWTNYPDNSRLHIVTFGEHQTSDDYYSSTAYGWFLDKNNNDGESLVSGSTLEVIGNIYQNPELIK
jgi:uncharacterized phage protein (TIGR01671 family)